MYYSDEVIELTGDRDPILFEPLIVVEEYSVQWAKPLINLDFDELVSLKTKKQFTNVQLAKHYKVGLTTIKTALKRKSVHRSIVAIAGYEVTRIVFIP